MLGDLVNVVARYLREQTRNYVQEIRGPALKLLGLYGLQVSTRLTCQSFDTSQVQSAVVFLLSNGRIYLI